MEELLVYVTEAAILLIEFLALIVIVFATLQAFLGAVQLIIQPSVQSARGLWARYGHWLVAGLTFQLAADIIETAITPGWDDIGRLAATAAVRTFLNFFLERDLGEVRELVSDSGERRKVQ